MARVQNIEVEEVQEDLRWIYEKSKEYGPFINQVKVFAHSPVILRHMMSMMFEMADAGVLQKRHLEIALVTVSRLNECRYCVAHHAPRLLDTGLSNEIVSNILDPKCPGLDSVDRLVRDYSVKVTNHSKAIPKEILSQMRDNFSEAQIVELTFRIALCGFYNRFNEALNIEIENGVMEELLSKGGTVSGLPPAPGN